MNQHVQIFSRSENSNEILRNSHLFFNDKLNNIAVY